MDELAEIKAMIDVLQGGRFLEGSDGNLGNRIEAGLPNITGTLENDQSFLSSGKSNTVQLPALTVNYVIKY